MLVVAPVKVRNSIDITPISEITNTTAMTTLSTSLKLPFTDVVETAPWRPIEQGQCRYDMKRKTAQIRTVGEKVSR